MSRRTDEDMDRLAAAGYKAPRQRESCSRCALGTLYVVNIKGTDYARKDIYCTRHRTSVACGGWCPAHTPVAQVRRAA